MAVAVLGRPEAIAAIPRPEGSGCYPKAASYGSYRQLGLDRIGAHGLIMPVSDRSLYFKSLQTLFRGLNNL
jgi:hypothetical protein